MFTLLLSCCDGLLRHETHTCMYDIALLVRTDKNGMPRSIWMACYPTIHKCFPTINNYPQWVAYRTIFTSRNTQHDGIDCPTGQYPHTLNHTCLQSQDIQMQAWSTESAIVGQLIAGRSENTHPHAHPLNTPLSRLIGNISPNCTYPTSPPLKIPSNQVWTQLSALCMHSEALPSRTVEEVPFAVVLNAYLR